ncbi:hypothetical protein NUACC21_11390 [Scytonema sp. NUACC21]
MVWVAVGQLAWEYFPVSALEFTRWGGEMESLLGSKENNRHVITVETGKVERPDSEKIKKKMAQA